MFYRFRLLQFHVLQIPSFTIPGFTDSGFYNSGSQNNELNRKATPLMFLALPPAAEIDGRHVAGK
jgi:hypothetical protein